METAKILNASDEWEDVVNRNHKAIRAGQAAQKRKRVSSRATSLAVSALISAALAVASFVLLPDIFVLSAACACFATLQIGRFMEVIGR